jgi:hypothetical protein
MAKSVPPDVSATAAKLAKEGVVDLMVGPSDDKDPKKKPSLKNGVPATIVATTPTELIVTDGASDWVPTENSSLVYVKDTTGNVFLYMNDQKTYILVAGRWFRGAYLTGPWEYVAGADLPPDFAAIADDSPKENVKASVPGTPQAQEAVIANEIPQMATIDRAVAQFTPQVNGAPELQPISSTPPPGESPHSCDGSAAGERGSGATAGVDCSIWTGWLRRVGMPVKTALLR